MQLRLGRSVCGELVAAERREWIVTNGLGGFAAGTVAGSLTRRYHGFLFAATTPSERTLLLTKIDETAQYGGDAYELATNRWRGGAIAPHGYAFIENFALEGTVPVWRYALAEAILEKSLWMEYGANATYVRYVHARGKDPLDVTLKVLVNFRDFHAVTSARNLQLGAVTVDGGIDIQPAGARPFYVRAPGARFSLENQWYRDFALRAEAERGLESFEDHLCAAIARIRLEPGGEFVLLATSEPRDFDPAGSLERRRARDAELVAHWERAQPEARSAPAWVRRCVLAADAFVVAAPLGPQPAARTIIAGYPWFGVWSRDALVALPGLTLATGRPDVAAGVLRTLGAYVDGGMLPNYLPRDGETAQYNSVDAPLWFIEAVAAYVAATGDAGLLAELFPALERIVKAYRDGTRYGIGLDPADGLVRAGEPGVQLTWMDAKVADRVITPRSGKPVEVAALWYNAMRRLAALAPRAGRDPETFSSLAERARAGFDRFWNPAAACCYDVLDGPAGADAALRPNQLFAVSLPHSPLSPARQRAVVTACGRHLLACTGLRSLAPGDVQYIGRYAGPPAERDAAYHQGTAWTWLLGVFATAYARAFGDPAGARGYLAALEDAMWEGALGTLGEIADGDAPFAPRGAFAQAWSVGEALRAWHAADAGA